MKALNMKEIWVNPVIQECWLLLKDKDWAVIRDTEDFELIQAWEPK